MDIHELRQPLCTLCPLHETARTICVMGNGPVDAIAMIIGEAPGANEDEEGKPFVGKSGQLLDRTLASAGLLREDVYVTNVVKCRPPGNRAPDQEEMDACVKYLIREYKLIQPKYILLLGNAALHSLTSIQEGITKARGLIPNERSAFTKSQTYATIHPSAVRGDDMRAIFESDVRTFCNVVLGTKKKSVVQTP